MSTITLTGGTQKLWASTGDYDLSLASLASGQARMGEVGDLGSNWGVWHFWRILTKWGTAPTDGTLLRIFLAPVDNTVSPQYLGGVSGSDAAITGADALTQMERDLAEFELPAMVADNTTDTRRKGGFVKLPARYVVPVVYNDGTGQALNSTAGNHGFWLIPVKGNVA